MKRSNLEHLIRAAGAIADDRQIAVIGSQAVLGQFPDAPEVLLASMEADIFLRNYVRLQPRVHGDLIPFGNTTV